MSKKNKVSTTKQYMNVMNRFVKYTRISILASWLGFFTCYLFYVVYMLLSVLPIYLGGIVGLCLFYLVYRVYNYFIELDFVEIN